MDLYHVWFDLMLEVSGLAELDSAFQPRDFPDPFRETGEEKF